MNVFEYPDYIARFYDVIYHRVRDGVDNSFFLNQATSVKGKVLELGCGTGRLFINAFNKGVDIFGTDISKSMTDILKSRLPESEHYRIKTEDAVSMKWGTRFDLILAPFRMISHVLEVENQLRLLNNMYEHLTEAGTFIFDVFVPDPMLLANGIHDLTDFNGEYETGKRLKRTVNSNPDVVNQLLNVSMKLKWDEDNAWQEKEWHFQMRFFYRYELEHLIHLSPLKLETIYGDYLKNPLHPKSKEFIVVCRKLT
ncbi:MAG: class I SAM-dependent methyltransferase [Bacteroidales bacterium]|nr:class I SAM-dependent methyltransferase [Bacteroidales bacterium]